MDDQVIKYLGIAFVVFGVVLGYKYRRRRFDRTNEFGIERFPSYWEKLAARTKDGTLWISSVSLTISGVLILASQYQDSWGAFVLLPFILVAIILI
jgi:multisubunit Na+/H+ antiporter MnhG subunit